MPVKGIDRVKRNFRAALKEIGETQTERAVFEILSQGGALAAQMTPIDTSTLVSSHFVDISTQQGRVVGTTGYTANYALQVHQASGVNVGKGVSRDPANPGRGNVWDPNAEPGFLRKGFEELKPSIPTILKRNYRA